MTQTEIIEQWLEEHGYDRHDVLESETGRKYVILKEEDIDEAHNSRNRTVYLDTIEEGDLLDK